MTKQQLLRQTRAELLDLAKKHNVKVNKEISRNQLLRTLIPVVSKAGAAVRVKAKPVAAVKSNKAIPAKKQLSVARKTPQQPAKSRPIKAETSKRHEKKRVVISQVPLPSVVAANRAAQTARIRDRVTLDVRDPHWLHCHWDLSAQAVGRAEAALGAEWHGAIPILRLVELPTEETSPTETVVRDVAIHGDVNNWYLDVDQPPRCFRVDIGYRTMSGRFYSMARSNVVHTPKPGLSDPLDTSWKSAKGSEQVIKEQEARHLFEEHLRRPMTHSPALSFSSGAIQRGRPRQFWFEVDAELIVYGATEPTAKVHLQGEHVQLRPDGSFTIRFALPDGRLIIPAVATSADGVEERTVVLALERNTKVLEPMIHDGQEI